MTSQFLVLGAGYGGLLAALRLARLTRRRKARVILVDQAATMPDRIRLHEALVRKVPQHRLADLIRGSGVTFVQGRVDALQPSEQTVTVTTSVGPRTFAYDRVIYALGSFSDRDAVPGVRQQAVTLAPDTAAQLQDRLPELAARRAQLLVCGGGLSGIEVASEIAEAYPTMRVALATAGTIGPGLSPRARRHVGAILSRLRVTVHEHTPILAVEVDRALTPTGGLPFDLCVWTGPLAVSAIARNAGLTVDVGGRILVDQRLRSVSHPTVTAIGDAATLGGAQRHIRPACATATAMGAYAATALADELAGSASQSFRLAYLAKNISLGRREAVVDWVQPDDTPRDHIWTGWPAVWWKNVAIARLAVWTQIRAERFWNGSYQATTWQDRPEG